jgi:hypothetical protein
MLPQIDTMIGFSVVMLLFSLLITILVQAVVAGASLRRKNLLTGVTVILEHALPELKTRAGEIAEKVLNHSTVTLGNKVNATAIRSDELIRVLDTLAKQDDALKECIGTARNALAGLDATADIQKAFEDAFPDEKGKIADVMSKVRAQAVEDMDYVKAWYDTVMDRTSERFSTWTRLVTVGSAAVLSLGLHIDSIALFKRLSTNGDLRAHLTQGVEASAKLADDVLRREGAWKQLAADVLEATKRSHPEVTAPVDRNLATRAQGAHWILTNVPASAREAFSRDYEDEYDKALTPLGKEMMASAKAAKAQLEDTQLILVPPFPARTYTWESILGMLITTLFLSLGAPFWYNVLQQLGNLRPLLAGKVDSSEAKKGSE